MLLIDIKSTPKKAFTRGFLKGFASPLMLFGEFQANPLVFPTPIDINAINPQGGLVNDFAKVTGDFCRALIANGKKEK